MVLQKKKTYRKTLVEESTHIYVQNVLYEDLELKIWGTSTTDRRVMSFVDNLWGFEVTGGSDQYEPLTVIGVKRSGLARRAGIRINDIIIQINSTPATNLTLKEAQLLIRESGKYVRIYVRGDNDGESDDELTVDFWWTPPSENNWMRRKPGKLNCEFPWNDRSKPIYRESNCCMVISRWEMTHEHSHTEEHSTQNALSESFEHNVQEGKGR